MVFDSLKFNDAMVAACVGNKELATTAGVSVSTVARILRNDSAKVGRGTAGRLAKALGVEPRALVKRA